MPVVAYADACTQKAAAAHMDTLKGIAQDMFSLGAALMSAATML